MDYTKRKRTDRGYNLYEMADTPGMWRIRLELYPEHTRPKSGWWGGRVLFNQDTTDYKKIKKIANDWYLRGILPEGE